MTTTVAFIGLGTMGYPMAAYLARAGYHMHIYNRTMEKAEKWAKQYAAYQPKIFNSPAAAADGAEFVISCVGNDDDVEEVTIGVDGAFNAMAQNSFYIDHTTVSAKVSKRLYAIAKERSIGFLDAPVSGGQSGAENGILTIMVGGDEKDFTRVEPILHFYARSIRYMGASGAGQLTKMVNQICIAGIIQSLSEGIHFAERAGLDITAVVDVISKGAAQSWQMDNRSHTMAERKFDFGFAVDWVRKDLKIAMEEAENNGAHLPLTAIVDQYYEDIQAVGGNRWDTSSLIKRLDTL